jgi:GT2 family glycosyltransferase
MAVDQPELSIIILNWNSVDFLKECVDSISRETFGISYEIIVADGASFDGSEEMLSSRFPNVRFVQLVENGGFAKGNNAAARLARADVFLFLNPDTIVLDGAIQKLYTALKTHPEAGAAGTLLLNSDGTLQTSAVQAFPSILNQVLDFDFLLERWKRFPLWGNGALYQSNPCKVDLVSGACLMIWKDLFVKIGGFNESYFMYAEDAHLCWDVKRLGRAVYFFPEGKVVHHGGGSSSRKPSASSCKTYRQSIFAFLQATKGPLYASFYRYSMMVCATTRLALLYALRLVKPSVTSHSINKWRHVLDWARNCKCS